VSTLVLRVCASMGSVIRYRVEKGMRFSLPNAEFLVHQAIRRRHKARQQDILIRAPQTNRSHQLSGCITLMLKHFRASRWPKCKRRWTAIKWMTHEEALAVGGHIRRIVTKRDTGEDE